MHSLLLVEIRSNFSGGWQASDATDEAAVSHPNELASAQLDNKGAAIRAVVSYVETLMAEDKKSTGLKALQVSQSFDPMLSFSSNCRQTRSYWQTFVAYRGT